ncbi:MAG: geranylgeranylglyceryl/heptaprenylglyceryl phosphate synthase [Melioribacteraceae bacterium]|nr:geranylgeranylglyceryl/heptaprenylglyceryl phosphate synthase [Melioribacteraceae bacterium]MCF8264518.1 geranylgeranylglyceryl/heptaprenylglyceryl phosphate synthase [Melioribacteraceae bacterium]MCF8412484.1 geranylgeranylglyceryl/heptaprenylglyceryl phosphate synthase [Melioribacteraceae bacterium]
MTIQEKLIKDIEEKGAIFLVLIDPDEFEKDDLIEFVDICSKNGVDALLVGGSLMVTGNLEKTLDIIKENCDLPRIIFPGGVSQVSSKADAILFISLISGRNGDQLIGQHVMAAPGILQSGIEPISTGYMLIESGKRTTAEYMSGTNPIPRNKPEIAAATALAAQYIGMKLIYLEAGSGADMSVPEEMIQKVSKFCKLPLIVGGGIRDPQTAAKKIKAGAKAIVVGNYFEDKSTWSEVKDFAMAIHENQSVKFV